MIRRLRWKLNPPLLIGGGIVALLVLCALAAPLLAPFDPMRVVMYPDGSGSLRPPYPPGTAGMWLGSDALRRDLLSRLIYGTRYTLLFCAITASMRVLLGATLGALAGWYPNLERGIDIVISAWSALPSLFFALLPLAIINRLGDIQLSTVAFVLVLGLTGWAETAVRTKAAVQALRDSAFVEAARAIGRGRLSILWHHIAPNLRDLLLIEAAYAVAGVLLLNAELAFLGVYMAGAEREVLDTATRPDPLYAEWGSLLAKGVEGRRSAPWTFLAPMVAFALSILAFNLLADGLRKRRA